MDKIKLSNRLQAIVSFVPIGAKVADIGTDHGYIPVWLAQNKIADKIAAADINFGPLEHAKRTAQEFEVSDFIDFKLCSGLDFPDSSEYNTIIIAGMGGELIQSIIEAASWTRNDTTLILQPNSKIQDLVEWLLDNEYQITQTKLVKDGGKLYQILIVCGGNGSPIAGEAHRLIHELYFKSHDPLLAEYLDSLLRRYKQAERGMQMGKEENTELIRIQQLIQDLEHMKKETEKW